MLLHELLSKFYLSLEGTVSPRTIRWYRERLTPLKRLSDQPVTDVRPDDLYQIYADLVQSGQYSVYTLHGFVRAWRRLFRWAHLEGFIDSNPASRLRFPQLPDEPPKGISDADIVKMLRACTNIRDRAIILFLTDTGARLGGVAGLKIDDLDLERRRALVREKGRRARFVFFSEATSQALREWLASRHDNDPRVFPLSPEGIYSMLRRCAQRAGIKGRWNPHAFRHAFARRLLSNGGNLAQVSQLLGHSTIYVTAQFYGRFAIDELQLFHERYNKLNI